MHPTWDLHPRNGIETDSVGPWGGGILGSEVRFMTFVKLWGLGSLLRGRLLVRWNPVSVTVPLHSSDCFNAGFVTPERSMRAYAACIGHFG